MRRAFLPLAVFPVVFGIASLLGGYPWPLAILTALAVAALTYSTEGSVRRLAVLYRRGGESGPWRLAPWEEQQGDAQEQVHGGGGGRSPEEKAQPGSEQAAGNEQSRGA